MVDKKGNCIFINLRQNNKIFCSEKGNNFMERSSN